jgi:hypothetical protein
MNWGSGAVFSEASLIIHDFRLLTRPIAGGNLMSVESDWSDHEHQ